MKPATKEAVKLMHEGMLALSQVEANGFRIDTDYLDREIPRTQNRIKEYEQHLLTTKVGKLWKKVYGDKMKFDATNQLAVILYDKLGYKHHSETRTGQKQADKTALQRIDIPFTRDYLKMRALSKLCGTYYQGIRKETEADGLLHASFDLNLAATYRSSASNPNLTNIPIRNFKIGNKIRKAFIPYGPNYSIDEMDMSGAEVRVGAFYHKDPRMLEQIRTHFDPHKTLASKLFGIPLTSVSKQLRQEVKGDFTFAEGYGSYYIQCAARMWDQCQRQKLTTEKGTDIFKILAKQGITKLGLCDPEFEPRPGTFELRVKEVEDLYWNDWHPVFKQWRKDFYAAYRENGYFQTKTGFNCVWGKRGLMRRNDVLNYAVQGSSFHCLLKTLIYMTKWLRKYKMRSKIVSEIHDSIIFCNHKAEQRDVIETAKWYITEQLRKEWTWILLPLETEVEGSDVNWAEKKPLEFAA